MLVFSQTENKRAKKVTGCNNALFIAFLMVTGKVIFFALAWYFLLLSSVFRLLRQKWLLA